MLHKSNQALREGHAAVGADPAVARVQDLLHDRVRGRAHAAYGQRGKVALQEVLRTVLRYVTRHTSDAGARGADA